MGMKSQCRCIDGNVFRRVLTMTDNEYRRTLLLGVIIGASTVILAFYMVKPEPQQPVILQIKL
jgi:hypothetical protein